MILIVLLNILRYIQITTHDMIDLSCNNFYTPGSIYIVNSSCDILYIENGEIVSNSSDIYEIESHILGHRLVITNNCGDTCILRTQ